MNTENNNTPQGSENINLPNIIGPSDPCMDSKVRYRYCPGSNFPYHWSWSITGDAEVVNLGTSGNCYMAEVTIKKRPATLTFHQSNPVGVPQVQDVWKYIQPKKCQEATAPILKLEICWASYTPNSGHPADHLLTKIWNKLKEMESLKSAEVSKHFAAETCSYVYWGCGSCGEGGARVDVYCGSGGSQPDFSWCEACN